MNKHLLRSLPGIVFLAIVTAVLLTAGTTPAATLLMHYDFNDPLSWNGATLADLQGFGAALTPDDGAPRNDGGPAFVPADFGTPVFTASGASSPVAPPPGFQARNRAFLDFTDISQMG